VVRRQWLGVIALKFGIVVFPQQIVMLFNVEFVGVVKFVIPKIAGEVRGDYGHDCFSSVPNLESLGGNKKLRVEADTIKTPKVG
jgi:hypothetical protein